jgi:large subunit ribosomal protein L13
MQTKVTKLSEITRKWYVFDAEGKVLGRLASEIANILRGKRKVNFSPNLDMGDGVIVVNAEKVRLTGKKLEEKYYYRSSRYTDGLKSIRCDFLLKTQPEKVIELAVKGMLPHNRLGRNILQHLRVYRGPTHPHTAQNPEIWKPKE